MTQQMRPANNARRVEVSSPTATATDATVKPTAIAAGTRTDNGEAPKMEIQKCNPK